jgi:hypothetical protein
VRGGSAYTAASGKMWFISNRDGGPEIRRCEVMRRRIVGLATKGTNYESKFTIYEYSLVTQRCRGHNVRFMRRPIVGLATNVLVSVGLGLGAGTSHADPGYLGPYNWCPGGKPLDVNWDQSICHTYWRVANGAGNVGGPGDSHNNLWEGPNPPRVPEGPCFSMWIPSPCPAG